MVTGSGRRTRGRRIDHRGDQPREASVGARATGVTVEADGIEMRSAVRSSEFVGGPVRPSLGCYATGVRSSLVPPADRFGDRERGDGVMCSSCVLYIRLLGSAWQADALECRADVWSRLTIASRVGIVA